MDSGIIHSADSSVDSGKCIVQKTPSQFLVFYRGVGGGSVCIDYPCGSSFGLSRRRTGYQRKAENQLL